MHLRNDVLDSLSVIASEAKQSIKLGFLMILILIIFLAYRAKLWPAFGLGVILMSAVAIFFPVQVVVAMTTSVYQENNMNDKSQNNMISLPAPQQTQQITLQAALQKRRSVRDFSDTPITLEQVSLILWAAQGVTNERGFRTAPSAGALYPLTIYILSKNVQGLNQGLYRFNLKENALHHIPIQLNKALSEVSYSQEWIDSAPLTVIIAAKYEITNKKYGERGYRYTHIEVGSVAQNVYLQATALSLGTTIVCAFYDEKLQRLLSMEAEQVPLAIMPIGYPVKSEK